MNALTNQKVFDANGKEIVMPPVSSEKSKYEKLPVIVRTISLDDTIESTKEIDYNNPNHRDWLKKHCFWALNNKRMIETSKIGDFDFS